MGMIKPELFPASLVIDQKLIMLSTLKKKKVQKVPEVTIQIQPVFAHVLIATRKQLIIFYF